MDDDDLIRIGLTALTTEKTKALQAVETFSRLLVGLALDGLDLHLDVSVLEEVEEEYEEAE